MENYNIEFKDLPKYLIIDSGKDKLLFHPVIFKWENDGNRNAYFGMYARYYPKTGKTNTTQVLFSVCACTFNDVVDRFLEEYTENKKYINESYWIGERPKIIDLMNMSVEGYLKVRYLKNR